MMVQIILGTDMTLHVELFSDLKRLVDGGTPVAMWSPSERALLRKFIVHTADISNPSKVPEINKIWATRILNEFFRQVGCHAHHASYPPTHTSRPRCRATERRS